ncbi:MAG TPA: RagB/SusD family nutrient uptake outer membrane protein [Pelobium sp.]|nr:RagB/SusD family nutrient uptake outer membrane protein [Pelobium sp.]
MKYFKIIILSALLFTVSSCKKYLDIVPDNIATIDNAFSMRSQAEKFLFTCYSYLPKDGVFESNPGFNTGDEVWYMYPPRSVGSTTYWDIARGNQSTTSPLGGYWGNMWIAIRDCNIFLENIDRVRDLDELERKRWVAEVKFLKAYYHYLLFRMYGPIPLMKENQDITSTTEELKIYRQPVDDCVNYIVELLDEAATEENMLDVIQNDIGELGRITRPIILGVKAKVLVLAASPLFNGNKDYVNFKDNKDRQLFNQTYDETKWERAANACRDAVDLCVSLGYKLHHFNPTIAIYELVPQTQRELDIRTAVTEKWNSEVIWGNTLSMTSKTQQYAMPLLATGPRSSAGAKGVIAPTLKMAELFYTKNGVPIKEDKTWNYAERFNLKSIPTNAVDAPENVYNKYYIKSGYETAKLNFDREPRYYADLGFDGGYWYGNGVGSNSNYKSSSMLYLQAKSGQVAARTGLSEYSITGMNIKKLTHFTSNSGTDGAFNVVQYPWPEIRLADLYLLYAEALNEWQGPSADAYHWINLVRGRAGIPDVEVSWSNPNWVNQVNKHQDKIGFREIIQQERMIEMAFEGQRYWDLLRWKKAPEVLNEDIKGWDIDFALAPEYYREKVLFSRTFRLRDYFWPIPNNEIIKNRNLVQNPGWL